MQEIGIFENHMTISARGGCGVTSLISRLNLVYPGLKYVEGLSFREQRDVVQKYARGGLVLCSFVSHIAAPGAYHVLLKCTETLRASRKFGRMNEGTLRQIRDLDGAEDKRIEEECPGFVLDESDFNLVIDTSETPLWETAKGVVNGFREYLELKAKNSRELPQETLLVA
jgi:hypothetical protein